MLQGTGAEEATLLWAGETHARSRGAGAHQCQRHHTSAQGLFYMAWKLAAERQKGALFSSLPQFWEREHSSGLLLPIVCWEGAGRVQSRLAMKDETQVLLSCEIKALGFCCR